MKKENVNRFTFSESQISKYLNKESIYNPEKYINLTTLTYERAKPGLIEFNWNKPFENTEDYFIFIAGSVLYRNSIRKENKIIPSPKDVLKIILEEKDSHYNFLKGNYYIMILNKINMCVHIYSSPMFMYPAYFHYNENELVFSNHIESFKEYIKPTINKQGLVEMELFDHCIGTKTIYNEINAIQGGNFIELKNGKVANKIAYDTIKWYTNNPESKSLALPKIKNSLQTSINDYINSTDKFNLSLTGGFDGRLNLSFIDKLNYNKMQAISYGLKESLQISVPQNIAKKLGFKYYPVYLNKDFETNFNKFAIETINLTGGVTGFNRAVYPYSYNIIKNFSRSCILGQCDMIRPLYNNPAGTIFNKYSWSIFFENKNNYINYVKEKSKDSIVNQSFYTEEIIEKIYNEIYSNYISQYENYNKKIQFYFFLLKESLMKYWHTEFHVVSIFVDDYVSFADLDYLEILFSSKYAGIYKGLLVENQFKRKSPHDLYVDLTRINNDKLNHFYNDRFFKPAWLKYGKIGWIISAIAKLIGKYKRRKIDNDTFNMKEWAKIFYEKNKAEIELNSQYFETNKIIKELKKDQNDANQSYILNRLISQKIWIQSFIK